MSPSKIEWTTETWNPTTGCDQVSPGCDHCYALSLSARLKAMGQAKYQTDGRPETSGPGFGVQVHPDVLEQPRHWHTPRHVFVDSMSDLFHPGVPDEFIGSVWDVMANTPHTYQILTKRPARARALLRSWSNRLDPEYAGRGAMWRRYDGRWCGPVPWPLANVWLGVSAEDQPRADERIPPLVDTPAAVRFVSAEPLLGPVDLSGWLGSACAGELACSQEHCTPGELDWVIVGGESGPNARPMHPQWACDLRDQVTAAGVAFFFKQWGAWRPDSHGGNDPGGGIFLWTDGASLDVLHDTREDFQRIHAQPHRRPAVALTRVGKAAAGRELDGRTWDGFPHTAARTVGTHPPHSVSAEDGR